MASLVFAAAPVLAAIGLSGTPTVSAQHGSETGWLCTSDSQGPGYSVRVYRRLEPNGRQRGLFGEWEVITPSKLRLQGSFYQEGEEQPVVDWNAALYFPFSQYEKLGSLQLVLGKDGREADKPHWQFESTLSEHWRVLRKRFRNGRIHARLVDKDGRTHLSGTVDIRDAKRAIAAAQQAIRATRHSARHFGRSCGPDTLDDMIPVPAKAL